MIESVHPGKFFVT
jgi:hypothetical protein